MYKDSKEFARQLDEKDPLSRFRHEFHIPIRNGKESIYFCGNSLGLQPKSSLDLFEEELEKWKSDAVEGHFGGKRPWVQYHNNGKKELSSLLGAEESEVVIMNNLTTNLHLLLASFYKPSENRKKIIIEKGAFPSDHYAVSSFMEMLGISPNENLVLLEIPEDGYLPTSDIIDHIKQIGEELALVMLPGIQYYTGQLFDMNGITKAAHDVGAYAGYDLAHAIGNVPMKLHENNVDFATWCSYKYLNSGPGNVSGVFVHQAHSSDPNFPKLKGWWGHNEKTRFKMDNKFEPNPGVDAWMLSNGNVMATSIHLASLALFDEAGIYELRKKSFELTGFLEFLITENQSLKSAIKILTPENREERGCQLSLYFLKNGREAFEELTKQGVIADWREPNVIRIAPTPMYNKFEEVYKFVEILKTIID